MSTKNESGIAGGLFWTFAERIGAQLVSTIVTMVIARILAPEHYGIISIVTVFISLCNVFVSSGFGSAVVRQKDADERDFNTAFFLSLAMACGVYLLLFLGAPLVARFYAMPTLTAVMRVMGLRIPLAALNTIQHAYIQRQMHFRRFFYATLIGTIVSGVVGIALALAGFGVWALVAQYLTNTTIDSVVLLLVGGWRPRLQFSRSRAAGIVSFGWKVLATDLVATFEGNLRSLIVGKVFGSADLAFYEQGRKYTGLLVDNINSSINKVMLPVYARHQDDHTQLKAVLRRSIRIGIFLLGPILLGFFAVAEQFVLVFLTEKWLPCVPYLQICCVAYLTRPLETTCHKMILAIGRGDIALKVMIAVNVVAFSTLLLATFLFESVLLVALGSLAVTLVSLTCFMASAYRLIGYRPTEQLRDILPSLGISALMGAAVLAMGQLALSPILLLLLQIPVGGLIYGGLSLLFNRAMIRDLLSIIRKKQK